MKHRISTVLFLCLFISVPVRLDAEQRPCVQKVEQAKTSNITKPVGREEKLIRDLYVKASEYNRATQDVNRDLQTTSDTPDGDLQFTLSNFRFGPIQEIFNTRYIDLISLPTGEVISLNRSTTVINKGPEEVTFKAEWTKGRYSSGFDPEWMITHALNFEPAKYADVGRYASYDVRVSFAGRSRDYKAIVLFHDIHQSSELGTPEFWDAVVDDLNAVWKENRPKYKPKPELQKPTREFEESSQPVELLAETSFVSSEMALLDSNEEGSSGDSLIGDGQDFWFRNDFEEHASGSHGGTAKFTPTCTAESNNRQLCKVQVSNFEHFESGTLDDVFGLWFHKGIKDATIESTFGPAGTNVSCKSAVGVAFSSCLIFTGCQVNISVQANVGVVASGATVTGGNLWRAGAGVGNICNLPAPTASGTCTTAAWDGTCPIGTSPNGFGFCCFNQTNACASNTFINKCFMYGGDYDFLTCSCSGCDTCGGSPVVIDVNGDGIALSGPTAGVDFDLNGNGTRDRLGWTLANSDDAWLVLDRNGNGNIDNGAELFGDFTPQPATSSKNGFLALAEFDKAANGGNGDGVINNEDSIFPSLRLWQDKNHNGIAEVAELKTLSALDVNAFELDFKESKRVDGFGNEFRYRAKVKDTKDGKVGRWAWDVFLSH